MAEISWIKLSVNLFDDEKIKLIRSMPEGDSILLIWIQLLCLAGKTNDGGAVYMGQNMYYTDEMLSTICNQPLSTVRLALNTFNEFEMIALEGNGLIQIENWEKHQSTDKMARIKKQNRDRKRKYDLREQLRSLGIDPDSAEIPDELHKLEDYVSNVTGTLRNDIEVRSKKLEVRSKKIDIVEQDSTIYPYKEIIEYLNNKANKSYKSTTSKTKDLIKARWNEGFRLDDFKKVIDNKVLDWESKPEMSKYLRPETLFGTKFEGYLNEQVTASKKTKGLEEDDRISREDRKRYVEEKMKRRREELRLED